MKDKKTLVLRSRTIEDEVIRISFVETKMNGEKEIYATVKKNRKWFTECYVGFVFDTFEENCFRFMDNYKDWNSKIEVVSKNFDFTCHSYKNYSMRVAYRYPSVSETVIIDYDDYVELRTLLCKEKNIKDNDIDKYEEFFWNSFFIELWAEEVIIK